MSRLYLCLNCNNHIPSSVDRCPHCGRWCPPPNVRAAEDPDEYSALEDRYQTARTEAATRGADEAVNNFEAALANTVVVISRSLAEVERLATSDNELYATYYQLTEAEIRLPEGNKWDILRAVTDSALFPGYKKHIRFAALSLDGVGLSNYGECWLVFRTDMIAHRASVFEENSVMFMKHRNVEVYDTPTLPKGYRATWENRHKLCVAKLAGSIDSTTRADEYSGLLLRQGATSEEDEFVEVHIWGPMTARTIERVTFTPRKNTIQNVRIKALRQRLEKTGATLKVKR